MPLSRRCALVLVAILNLLFPAVALHAQAYTSIVVFGDSLTDTGNDAYLSQQKYFLRIPGPIANYTDGRFTDGTDTYPAAIKYQGVWVEQLAAMLPNKPVILDSLNGGTNYAYGYAFTGQGTSDLVLTNNPITLDITVDNIGQQIANYLATKPVITNKTLFVLWGGANDILNAKGQSDIIAAATNQAFNFAKLLQAGATQFLILNLPPLGATPDLNGSTTTSTLYTEAAAYFNRLLAQDIAIVESYFTFKHLGVWQLDVYSLFNKIIATPSTYGLTNVTSMSQGQPVIADNYLFWDDLHPTTHGHNILANTALQLLKGPATGEQPATPTPAAP